MVTQHIDFVRHPIGAASYVTRCREQLDRAGALVLPSFFTPSAVAAAIDESSHRASEAFYARTTHNVFLTPSDPTLAPDHAFNRQVASSKGLLADDQIPTESPLREVYDDPAFRGFLCGVLGIERIHPYADPLSSINVHFAGAGQELGWHFDNSSFAVTMLLRAPTGGGVFEYVADVRSDDEAVMFERIDATLDGTAAVSTLEFEPGALVLFRGRNALHRVTPTEGDVTRMLVVFAYNDEPGVALSESALRTFYGRVPERPGSGDVT